MQRLFFALWPDDSTRSQLRRLSVALPLTPRQRVRLQNLHVTLVFIGAVEEALLPGILNKAAEIQARPFTLMFDRLEYWRGPGILCLTSSKPEAAATPLVQDLSVPLTAMGFKLDARPYCPHITLARHVREKPEFEFKPLRWHAKEMALVESVSGASGVVYTPLKFWPLTRSCLDDKAQPSTLE